jgi:hypothetical protein
MKQLQTITILTFLFITSLLPACNNNEKTNTDEAKKTTAAGKPIVFDKLVGTWKKEEANSFEKWSRNDDGTYTAVAFTIKGTDTSWDENARIFPENNNWVFENTVRGQNDGKAIKFTSTKLDDNSVQFSNPAHDFPTDINYTLPDANTVNAFIVGPNSKGGKDTIPFNYTRHK